MRVDFYSGAVGIFGFVCAEGVAPSMPVVAGTLGGPLLAASGEGSVAIRTT